MVGQQGPSVENGFELAPDSSVLQSARIETNGATLTPILRFDMHTIGQAKCTLQGASVENWKLWYFDCEMTLIEMVYYTITDRCV